MTTPASRAFGEGWLSGVLSVTLGAIGLGAVFCFHYPSLLTMPELRGLYPIPFIRALLQSRSPADVLRFATAAAALSCTREGAIASVPALSGVERLAGVEL